MLYTVESWDNSQLQGMGQFKPAGPLYNIHCSEDSILYLHLPHCEIHTGKLILGYNVMIIINLIKEKYRVMCENEYECYSNITQTFVAFSQKVGRQFFSLFTYSCLKMVYIDQP